MAFWQSTNTLLQKRHFKDTGSIDHTLKTICSRVPIHAFLLDNFLRSGWVTGCLRRCTTMAGIIPGERRHSRVIRQVVFGLWFGTGQC